MPATEGGCLFPVLAVAWIAIPATLLEGYLEHLGVSEWVQWPSQIGAIACALIVLNWRSLSSSRPPRE
ncbi:MAG: hypothetical protein ACR2GB_02410 [Nocardioidaceae bacterium]